MTTERGSGRRLAIIGCGGFGRELVGAARAHVAAAGGGPLVFASDDAASLGKTVLGLPVIGTEELTEADDYVIAIANWQARRDIAARVAAAPVSLIARTVVIGPDVSLGPGAVFCDQSVVTASARIGAFFQSNIYSYIAHDCVIGDYVTFAPRVACNGNVHIEEGAYIGTGAVIRQGTPDKPLTIGAGAIVGMGAVVTKDVAPGATVIGNPARPMG